MNTAKITADHRPKEARARDLEGFYSTGGALELWNDKEAWRLRAAHEGSFYKDILNKEGAKRVLDTAAAAGFHAIGLSQAGFSVTAADGLSAFVEAGRRNQFDSNSHFPFVNLRWSELTPQAFAQAPFDAALCLGGSLHHTDKAGVAELFVNVRTLLRPGGIFVVEQRNYEQLFTDRPKVSNHPCGWTYNLEFVEPRTVFFHLMDITRGINVRCECIVTFERELLEISERAGFRVKASFFDFGKTVERENASWIQFIFEAV
jgi:SAM-dependent methyltransferase